MSLTVSNPSPRQLRVAILGAGMSGILAAVRLKQQGLHSFTIFEKADRIGGTWRENTYPGLYCDVPAHAYTYSFAPNPEWSGMLASGAEIQRYFEDVVDQYQLQACIRFNTEINRADFNEQRQCWTLANASGEVGEFDVVIAATGVLHHPRMPEIDGLDSFSGACFHSARWDHSVALDGQRVAVIGSGSTGVQLISALAGRAAQLYHVQRTPQWVMEYPNTPYSDEERAAFRANPQLIDDIRYGEHYVTMVKRFTEAIVDADSPAIREIEAMVLDNLERNVHDPELREMLRPTYRAACKRLIYSPDYYEKLQTPGVEAVVGAIDRIESKGIRMADGRLLEVDVIALATGFQADRFVRPTQVKGRAGLSLDEAWSPNPSAYLGISVPEFPNFFLLNGPTGPVGNFSLIDIAERQWGHIEQLLKPLEEARCRSVELSTQAMRNYDAERIAAAARTIFASGCASWYLDSNGVPATWPWSYDVFAERTATINPDDYVFSS